MVARPAREARVSSSPPPPPPSPRVESTATMRLYGWRRKSRRNRIALIVPVIIFCGLLIVAGAYLALKPSGRSFSSGLPTAEEIGQSDGWLMRSTLHDLLKTRVADPNFEVVEWDRHEGILYIKIRHRALSTWILTYYRVRPDSEAGMVYFEVWPYYPPDRPPNVNSK